MILKNSISTFFENETLIVFEIFGYYNNLNFQKFLWPNEYGYFFKSIYGEPETGPCYCTKNINHWKLYSNNLNINENDFTQYWIFPKISNNINDYKGKGRFIIGLIDCGLEILNANDKFPKESIFYSNDLKILIEKLLIKHKKLVFNHLNCTNLNLYIEELQRRKQKIPEIFKQFLIIYKFKFKKQYHESTETSLKDFNTLQTIIKSKKDFPLYTNIELDFCFQLKSFNGFEKLPNISSIDIDSTSITTLEGLPNYKNLDYLSLDDVKIRTMFGCPNFSKLTYLNLFDSQLQSFKYMPNFENLQTLILENTNITSFNDCPNFKNLIELNLKNCNIKSFENCPNFSKLKILYLNKTKITSLKDIPVFKKLKKLYLNDSDITSLDGIEKFTNLTHLYLINCFKLKNIQNKHLKNINFVYF